MVEIAASLPASNPVACSPANLDVLAALYARADFHNAPSPDPFTNAATATASIDGAAVSSTTVGFGAIPAMRQHMG